jgi:prefoldin subunit 5
MSLHHLKEMYAEDPENLVNQINKLHSEISCLKAGQADLIKRLSDYKELFTFRLKEDKRNDR